MRSNTKYTYYLIADPNFCIHYSLEEVVTKAVTAGVTVVQLRDKLASYDKFLQHAEQLKTYLERVNIPLIINDRIDIAKQVDAAGVHLGQSDYSVEAARVALGPDKIIGLSIETPSQFEAVNEKIIDYYGVGPIFATGSKKDASQPWGIAQLKEAVATVNRPIVAIGGINATTIGAIFQTGAAGVAILSAICSAIDPTQATCELKEQAICPQNA